VINTKKIEGQLKKMVRLYNEVYPLIEGLPFTQPSDPDSSPLHYFRQAASLCNEAEATINQFEQVLMRRIELFEQLIKKVIEWDMQDEFLNDEDKAVVRKVMTEKRQALRKLGQNRKTLAIVQKVK